MNETAMIEWLVKAWRNIATARLLYSVDHYTDIIAVEIHYAIEKALKAFLAYENKKIPKTHDLVDIYKLIKNHIDLDDDLVMLKQITKYHIEEAYPVFHRAMPSKEEIKEALDFMEYVFDKVCKILNVDKESLK
jgi:HEPN domain-containing protein